MKYLDQFTISFAGLSTGRHAFAFEVDNKFFACFESSEITEGKVNVNIELEKSTTMLELFFRIEGVVNVMCDVCTDPFDLPIESEEHLIVKFGEEEFENTDEIVILPHGAHDINISQAMYEFICLAVPGRRVHPDGECNQEMINKINEYRAKEKEGEIDPRWEMLKNIKLN